nr:uncharacterized protein LOC113715962 [Coffea arabica]
MWRWWDAMMQSAREVQGIDRIKLMVNILWQIWKARNKITFQTENVDAKLIVHKAQQEWLEYEAANETDTRTNTSSEVEGQIQQKWEPLKEGVMTINTDAAISAKMVRTGLGIIARNWHGEIVKAKGIIARKRGDATTEEMLAIRGVLEMAKVARWTSIQSDCKTVVSLINTGNVQECRLQTILEDIEDLKKSFDCYLFSFVPRTANGCSHAMAQFAVKSVGTIEWEAQALNEALDMACIRRYLSATFEGDAFNVIEAAKNYAEN